MFSCIVLYKRASNEENCRYESPAATKLFGFFRCGIRLYGQYFNLLILKINEARLNSGWHVPSSTAQLAFDFCHYALPTSKAHYTTIHHSAY